MKLLWVRKYIVDSLGKGRLKLQHADTGKKLANTYHSSNVKHRPKYAEGPDDTISEDETAGEKASPKMPANTTEQTCNQRALLRLTAWPSNGRMSTHCSK